MKRLSYPFNRGKIWIDLDNSPHVPFFVPIIEKLRHLGFSVVLTARDCFQVCGLADLYKLQYHKVGRHYGKNLAFKLYGLSVRAMQLGPLILKEKPELAVSHGSRSQLLLSQLLGIPSLTIADYEFAKNPPFLRSTWVLVPDVIPVESYEKYRNHIFTYPGIKEDVYVPAFTPDRNLRQELGLSEKDVMVTVRPPATEAHYHSPKSELLYSAAMKFLANQAAVRVVLVPRNEKQAIEARAMWPGAFATRKIIIPDHVVNGLNLIWNSDLVISGGGTMNREGAALRVPVYSIFGGIVGAVDRYLAENGRLVLLDKPEHIPQRIVLAPRNRGRHIDAHPRAALDAIVKTILAASISNRGTGMANLGTSTHIGLTRPQ
jgi:predicted glycosyltransferase